MQEVKYLGSAYYTIYQHFLCVIDYIHSIILAHMLMTTLRQHILLAHRYLNVVSVNHVKLDNIQISVLNESQHLSILMTAIENIMKKLL